MTYKLSTLTSDIQYAGTDSKVFVKLLGSVVAETKEFDLSNFSTAKGKNLFEKGQRDDFELKLPDLGEIKAIDVHIDYKGMGSGWHLDKIVIKEGRTESTFPCGRWFDKSDGDVYGEEFAGGCRVEAVRVVHTESIRDPVEQIAWQLSQLVGAVSCRRERFLKLVIGLPVIPAHPKPAVLDIHIFGGVVGRFPDDVGTRGRG